MNIKALRMSKGLTQEQLAKEINVARSTVAMWESEESNPTAEKIPELARALTCKVDDLFSGTPANKGA